MVNYICDKCCKDFNKKSNYISHLNNKKKQCWLNNTLNNLSSTQTPPNSTQTPPNSTQTPPNSTQILPKTTEKIKKNKKINYICNFCQITFGRSDSLARHLTNICKIRIEESKEKEIIFKDLLTKYEEVKYLIEEKDAKIDKIIKEKDETINKLTEKIESLTKYKKSNVKNINNINNTTNNGTIIHNTIIVKNGEEDLSKIDNNVFYNSLLKSTGAQIPSKIIEGIHFNNKYPEFKNIYISDINRDKLMFYDGSEWILTKSNLMTSKLLDRTIFFSEDKFEELEEIIETFNKCNKDKIKKGLKNIELMKDHDLKDDYDDEGNLLAQKDIEKRKFLRDKALTLIRLTLYNNRNKINIQ
jgi:hypothetical protein